MADDEKGTGCMNNAIGEAAKKLEDAQAQFDFVESRFFERQASEDALRQAWDEREQARRALRAAHGSNAAEG